MEQKTEKTEETIRIAKCVDSFLKMNCNEHKEKKNGFDYLSWVWAWTEALKEDPLADFEPVLNADGRDYWDDGKTARVIVSVTIHGVTKRMSLAVMDYANRAIPLEKITECDANKSIMRCMVKCLAKFGLGLYIYAGEDLPADCGEDLKNGNNANADKTSVKAVQKPSQTAPRVKPDFRVCPCGKNVGKRWEEMDEAVLKVILDTPADKAKSITDTHREFIKAELARRAISTNNNNNK